MTEYDKAHIIDFIWWDVRFALTQLTKQVKNQQYKYIFIESDRKLFDLASFRYYCETTDLKNLARLTEISKECLQVVDLHNIKIPQIPDYNSRLSKPHDFETKTGGFMKLAVNFDCLKITGTEQNHVTEAGKSNFFKESDFELYRSEDFAYKCTNIYNTISTFFPELFQIGLFSDTISRLYDNFFKTGSTDFFDPFNFIEERHEMSKIKGKAFYDRLLNEYEKYKDGCIELVPGRVFYNDCIEYIDYCKTKIEAFHSELTLHEENQEQNERYFFDIESFGDGYIKSVYETLKASIKKSGYYTVIFDEKELKVYNAGVAVVFLNQELPVNNRNGKPIKVKTLRYVKYFAQGYSKGIKFFNDNYSISKSTLYENGSLYIEDLHNKYFHTGYKNDRQGWNFVKTSFPIILTEIAFDEFGYYSGIVNEVDELVRKHPSVFTDFATCEPKNNEADNTANNLRPSGQSSIHIPGATEESIPDFDLELKKIKEQQGHFWKGIPLPVIVEWFERMTQKKSSNGRPFLSRQQFVIFLKKGFFSEAELPKQKINCVSSEKGLVLSLFYGFFELAASSYSYPNRHQEFIELFNNCFDNWEPQSIKSFFRKSKKLRLWD